MARFVMNPYGTDDQEADPVLGALAENAARPSTDWWPVLFLVVPGVVYLVVLPLFMAKRSSRPRAMPRRAEYERLGFVGGHGVRFVGGVSASATDLTKRCSYPFGEMLLDEERLVLRLHWPAR